MKKTILIMTLLMLSVFAFGCSGGGNAISGKTTTSVGDEVSSPDDPQIDKSYDTKRTDTPARTTTSTKTTTKTTTTKSTPVYTESGEDKAKAVAKAFVKGLDGYKDFNGRNMRTGAIVQSGCSSCWIVDVTFNRDRPYYPDKEEIITVHIKMEDWEVDTYTFN